MPKLSRRDFLKSSALGLGGVLLAACSAPVPATRPPSPTDAPPTHASASSPTTAPATAKPKGKRATPAAPASATAVPASATATPAAASAQVNGFALLGRPTANSVAVSLLASTVQQVILTYGTTSGLYPNQTNPIFLQPNQPQTVELTQLAADTSYYYQALVDGVPSAEHRFHTQRAPGQAFTFTIDADPHHGDPNFNGQLCGITLANALQDQPDFHIDLGDTFMTEKFKVTTQAGAVDTYTPMRPYFGVIGADAPLFLVNGNHEGEWGWSLNGSDQNLAVWCTKARQAYYPSPVPNGFYSGSTIPEPFIGLRDGYYAWTWGDALFVALDPFWYTLSKPRPEANSSWGYTLGKAQYDWLKQTLETSPAKFKFIFIHNLVGGADKDARGGIEAAGYYEWGGQNQDGSAGFAKQRPGWDLPIHPLLVKHKVSAVFHGHDHVFVKQDLDDIVYQEMPQPSLARYDNTGLAAQYGYVHGDVLSSSGHVRVKVTSTQATVEYVRAYLPQDENASRQNGQIAYAYTLAAKLA